MKIKFKDINLKKLKSFKIKKGKEVKQEDIPAEKIEEVPQQVEEEIKEPTEEPVKEYRETLYSVGHEPEKKAASSVKEKKSFTHKIREDFEEIEECIDDLGKEKKTHGSSDVNKKVDMILSRKKK